MTLGKLKIAVVTDGLFRLDGGAMFGVVPRTLWEKRFTPDSRNRIILGLNILLIDNGQERTIVDTGIGSKVNEKFKNTYGLERQKDIIENLAEEGFKPEDIDKVILTHLHFDHAGGSTRMGDDGGLAPTFPAATYFIQKAEWEDASEPNERTKASYLKDNFMPLKDAGRLEILDGSTQIADGVRVELTGGHTRGHQIVHVESEGLRMVHPGDLVPTSCHLPLPYIMGYDTFPLQTLEMRKKLYKEAVSGRWKLFFGHDSNPKVAGLREKDGRIVLDEDTIVRFKERR